MSRQDALQLKFSVTDCLQCHAQREVAVRCPECGTKPSPSEVNTAVVERRTLLKEIHSLLDNPPSDAPTAVTDPQGLLDSTGPILLAVVRGFAKAVGFPNIRPLQPALRDYQEWRLRVGLLERVRPHVTVYDALQVACENLQRVVEGYLVALSAPDMATAQHQERAINLAIAEAKQAVAEVEQTSDRLANSKSSSPKEVVREALKAQLEASGLTPLELQSWAETRLERTLATTATQSIALDVVNFEFLVGPLIDMENFWHLLRRAFELFSREAWLETALESNGFIRDFQTSRIGLVSRTWVIGQTIAQAPSEQVAIDQIGQLIRDMVEGAGTYSSRVLLLASGRKSTSYDTLFSQNGTEHISKAQRSDELQDFVKFLDLPLRTAYAHAGTIVDETGLTATSKQHPTRFYSVSQLMNLALGAIEQTMAVLFALRLTFAHRGITIDDSKLHAVMGLAPLDLAEIVADTLWGQQMLAEIDTVGCLSIDASGTHRENLLLLLAQLGLQAAPTSRKFHVRHTDRGITRNLGGPATALQSLEAKRVSDNPLELISYLEAIEQLEFNGAPLLTEPKRRAWCSHIAIHGLAAAQEDLSSFRTWGPVLREGRAVAERAHDTDLTEALRACMRFVRTGEFPGDLRCKLRVWSESPDGKLP